MATFTFFLIVLLFYCWTSQVLTGPLYDPCTQEKEKETLCEFDCCYDRLTCRAEDDEPIYLGADSILRWKKRDGGIGFNFAYRFYNLRFMGTSKYWKPLDYEFHRWNDWSHNKAVYNLKWWKDSECMTSWDKPRLSNLVATLYYRGNYVVICGNKISNFTEYDEEGWLATRNNITDRSDATCEDKYPGLCIKKGRPELIDAFTIPYGDINKEMTVAYYGESRINLPTMYSREYTIYRIMDGEEKYIDKVEGQLSAIDIYEIAGSIAKGIFATNDGRVCPFEFSIDQALKKDFKFDFEHVGSNMQDCRALQTYLACPQAWCVDAFVDSSFTVEYGEGKELVYFVIYKNMWAMEAKPLPMDVPMVKNRIWLEYGDYEGKHPEAVQQVRSETSAAFTYKEADGRQLVISHKSGQWKSIYSDVKTATDIDKPNGSPAKPDAAWFDKQTKSLYLFEGDTYYRFEGTQKDSFVASNWQVKDQGTTDKLGLVDMDGKPDDAIDAVVSMNGTNYFFNQRFRYYEIPDGQTKVTGRYKLVQKHFFRLQSQCYYNDFMSYWDLMKRHNETIPEQKFVLQSQGAYAKDRKSSSEGSIAGYIILIILIGIVIAVIGLIAMFVIGKQQKNVFVTKVVKRHEARDAKKRSALRRVSLKS